jgi:hypothetical protein
MSRTTKQRKVQSGFAIAFGWLLGMAWLGLVFWGMVEAFGTEANFTEGHHPSRPLGYLLLAVAAAIFILTANRWKRVFPGIMLAATLNSLLELERGHPIGNSSVLIPRRIAFVQLVAIISVTAVSFTLKNRPLTLLDRVALLIFAVSVYIGGQEVSVGNIPVTLIGGSLCVMIAWALGRFKMAH